jgi:hypothetical protein
MNLETAATVIPDVFIYLTPGPGNTAWSNTAGAASVLAPTSKGFDALVANNPPKQEGGEYAGSSVPEPSAVVLLGSVLLVVAGAARRKLVR